jgi:hypothetical protein
VLAYKKDNRTANVTISTDQTTKQTIVLIAIQ